LLLSLNGHHLLLDGVFYSYRFIPLHTVVPFSDESFARFALKAFSEMFIIAFQMSAPIVGCLFLVDVALGVVARTVPQLNIFVVGLPVKVIVGFLLLMVMMATLFIAAQHLFETMFMSLRDLMNIIGGR